MGWIDRYTLVPFDRKKHLPLLWEYYSDPDRACLIGHVSVESIEAFQAFLDTRLSRSWVDVQILLNQKEVPVGFGFVHDLRPTSCSLSIALFPRSWGSGVGMILAVKMLQHIFDNYRVGRVFQWVFDTNKPSLKLHFHAHQRNLLEYHGFLPDQYVRCGRSYGTHVFSLTRDGFQRDYAAWEAKRKTLGGERI